jgi:predicted nucleic acid-binding protein
MIVVFDTNVWLSQLGLRSSAASGVRFFLKHHNFKVALPEVIRMEVEVNLRSKVSGILTINC